MAFRVLKPLATFTAASTITAAAAWKIYTRDSHFAPISPSSSTSTSLLRTLNPHSNPPLIFSLCERKVPLSSLKATDPESLTRGFSRGVWSGLGFAFERWVLEKLFRGLEGREDQLWDRKDLEESEYPVGTKLVDHFEVVERTESTVTLRAGDSPLHTSLRPFDGTFSLEVETDDKDATFRLRSIFFDSTPEGAKGSSMPALVVFLHRQYAKLLMETGVRKMVE